jgi:aldehyde dehydrogenase (NAD+)
LAEDQFTYGTLTARGWDLEGVAFETRDPGDPGRVIGRYAATPPALIAGIIANARAAQADWAARTDADRLALLSRLADRLEERAEAIARAVTLEQGKPIGEARGETGKSIAEFRQMLTFAAQPTGRVHATMRAGVRPITLTRPRGIIAAITPWNFPVLTPLRKIAPALAYGNAILLKPSELTPAAACLVAETATELLPPGLLQIVQGGAPQGRALIQGAGIDGITFTGSVPTGKQIFREAAEGLSELSLELGGKNAAVIHDVTDIPACLDQVAGAAFLCSGQRCTAVSRVIVHHALYDAVLEGLAQRANAAVLGHGLNQGTTMGPLVSEAHLNSVTEHVAQAMQDGATLRAGGSRAEDPALAQGHFFQPTVLAGVAPDSAAAREEIFGPVISVLPYDNTDEAFGILNGVDYGLSAALFSQDRAVIERFRDQARAGMLHVNHGTTPDSNMPFGGIGASGVGAYSVGPSAAQFYTTEHAFYDSV